MNGACLTVTEFDKTEGSGWFSVWLANETLARTELGEDADWLYNPVTLKSEQRICVGDRDVGDVVNLERAMEAHTRFGGHFVQVCQSIGHFKEYALIRCSHRHM